MRCPECRDEIGKQQQCECGWRAAGTSDRPGYEGKCQAYGCPLPAGIVTSRHQDNSPKAGACRFHFSAQPEDFQEVTRRIRENKHLVVATLRLNKASWGEINEIQPRMFGNDEETAPREGERPVQWAQRLRGLLEGRVLKDLSDKPDSHMTPEEAHHRHALRIQNLADSIMVNR